MQNSKKPVSAIACPAVHSHFIVQIKKYVPSLWQVANEVTAHQMEFLTKLVTVFIFIFIFRY